MAIELKRLLNEINEDDTICIVLQVNFEAPPYIKGYHEYEKIWTPFVGEYSYWDTETTVRCNEIATFTRSYLFSTYQVTHLMSKSGIANFVTKESPFSWIIDASIGIFWLLCKTNYSNRALSTFSY